MRIASPVPSGQTSESSAFEERTADASESSAFEGTTGDASEGTTGDASEETPADKSSFDAASFELELAEVDSAEAWST
jgi:hypothetical protein